MGTNIDYWKKILKDPPEAYKNLFKQEREILKENIKTGNSVLDIGCGDGRNILSIVDITKNIIGVDIDIKAVRAARKNLKENPEVYIIQGSVFELPFVSNVFDVSIFLMTLVNLKDKKLDALLEIKRVTKEGGKIILSVYSEKAKRVRLLAYRQIGVPIERIVDDKFIFNESVGVNTSEQFSISDIERLVESVGLRMAEYKEVDNLAYLIILEKQPR